MFWRLHKAIFGPRIEEAIRIINNLGDSYQIVEGKPSQLAEIPFDSINEASLSITTLQDAQRLIRKDYPSSPWLFFNNNSYKVSYWLPRIDSNISVLNREALFIPFGMLKNLTHKQLDAIIPKGHKLFIKPDSGNKLFTGFSIVNDESFHVKLSDNLMFSHVEPEEMCVLSPHVELEDIEWRFWIAENKVIGFTPYAWESEPELSQPPTAIIKIAEKMAHNNWQPDYLYVVDFCITQSGEVMLLEINAASTSGVYKTDLNLLLQSIKNTCEREYSGDIF